MRVCDVMQRPVTKVRQRDQAKQADVVLTKRGFAGLPVVDRDDRLVGVLTATMCCARASSPTRLWAQ